MKRTVICVIIYVLSLCVAVLCLSAIVWHYELNGANFAYFWLIIPLFIAMILLFPVSNLLHEIGHMLFGLTVKISAKPDKDFWRRAFTSCTVIPKTDKNLRARIIFTTFGGLAVNFILLTLGIVAIFVPAVPVLICIVVPASFYLLVLNAVPLQLEEGKTDGLVIYELLKNDDNAKVMLAVLTVQAQVLNGKPIEEVDEKLLFDLPVIQEDDTAFISLTQLRYEYFKAKGDEENMQKYMQRLEELKQYL